MRSKEEKIANKDQDVLFDISSIIIPENCSPSDVRFKKVLKKIAVTDSGINVYSFIYNKNLKIDGIFQGVIAQELLGTEYEFAVENVGGYYFVNYYKLPEVDLVRID